MARRAQIAEKGRMEIVKVSGQRGKEVRFARGTGEHAPIAIAGLTDQHDEPLAGEGADEQLAQIVHDLKNPLSSIALEAELLDARADFCDRAELRNAVGRILRNVTFLDRLIHDLMDTCTMSNARFSLRRERCNLGRLVATVIDRVVPSAEQHRVFLDTQYSSDVFIDELRIERVIANLLDNALKYTPQSASIVVRLSREQRSAQVSICDAGPGLSPGEAETIFEPYRRGTSSAGRSGNGLGLFVSKQIVEAHGGYIGVESVRGWGARFFFALPVLT